jgi:uncharacterized protein (DUF2236 family)
MAGRQLPVPRLEREPRLARISGTDRPEVASLHAGQSAAAAAAPRIVHRSAARNPVAQKINREIVVLLGWGRAILLQFSHPLIAAGLLDHSSFQTDIRGYTARAWRTVGAMLALTFGSEEEAVAAADGINRIHDRVSGTLRDAAGIFPAGTRYSARDPELLRWVHATLVDSLPLAYELFAGPLTAEEKDQYCAEAATVAPLLGIPEGYLPTTVSEHQRYMTDMYSSGEIQVTDMARRLAGGLLTPPLSPITVPAFSIIRLTSIGLLPDPIRDAYGFPWNPRKQRSLVRLSKTLRVVHPWLPRMVREWRAARRQPAHGRTTHHS